MTMQDPVVIKTLRKWIYTYGDPENRAQLGENAEERYQTWLDMLLAYEYVLDELETTKRLLELTTARLQNYEATP